MADRFLKSSFGDLNQFLENGARVYRDTGDHVEAATPECFSPRQAVLYDKALERKMARSIAAFNANREFINKC